MRSVTRAFALVAALTSFASFPGNAGAADKTEIPPVQAGNAQIVFMRSSTVNMLVGTDIFDVTSGELKLVGDMSNNRKVVLDVPPGDHVFMVGNMPWLDFLQASVEADKRYFVIVAPHWPTNFSPRAVKHQGEGEFTYSSDVFASLLKKTKLASPPKAIKPEKLEKIAVAYQDQWEKWQAKTPEEKAQLTIRPEDSIR